ncbi:hypothetical protein [Phocaeicola vulgatus]
MKKILFMIMTVLGWINLTSCNDYLDIVPKGVSSFLVGIRI